MEIGVLGPLQVLADDGTPVTPAGRHQRLLLGVLVAAAGRVVSVDELAESLWQETQPSHPAAALQSQVSRLRRGLGSAGPWIVSTPSGYCLDVSAGRIDAVRFEQCLAPRRGDRDPPEALLERLDSALRLWRGPAFADLDDPRLIAPEAARLEELRTTSTELRAELQLRLGRAADAARTMRGLVHEQPFRERSVALLMRALARDGRPVDASAEYRRFRLRLADELGLAPSPALQALHRRITGTPPSPRRALGIGEPGNSFVGRADELKQAKRLLHGSRLVTLTGPGGVGKTRIAAHVAVHTADDYPDGVHLCELSAVPEAALVTATVAAALAVEPGSRRSLTDRIVDALRGRRVLLVIDNCEHVLDGAAGLVSELLHRTSEVSVLATSRERLGVEGEQRLPIEPLPTEGAGSAVTLFLDRASGLHPVAVLDDPDSAAAVAELCRRLGGLPLAVELAAAQTVWRSPREILSAVAGRLDALADPRRPVGRHRSLDAVFAWSADLLTPEERAVFERLAVFSDGFTASAAVAVASGTEAILPALVERSLVAAHSHGSRTRYRLLEPVRQYAEGLLTRRGAREEVRQRHAAWAVAVAESADAGLRGPDEVSWRATLDAELANLRGAHRWCLDAHQELAGRLAAALYRWTWSGAPAEVYGWAEQVVSRYPGAPPGAHAAAALGRWHRGDLTGAHDLATAWIARGSDDATAAHLVWEVLGDIECFRGRFDASISAFGRAADLARTAGSPFDEAVALQDRALSRAYAGRVDAALADCAAAAPLVESVANPSLTAWWHYTGGEVRLETAPADALPLLRRGLAAARHAGNRFLIGVAGLSTVSCEGRTGSPATALLQYADVIDHWRRHGARNMQWATVRTLVELLVRIGRDEEAARLYGAMGASTSAPPLAGADAARIAESVTRMRARLGGRRFAELCDDGAGFSDDQALGYALDCCRSPDRTGPAVSLLTTTT